jgi:DNA-binding transcriptional MerR regulator
MEKPLPPIPAKRYFTIGEVSELCGVKPYVLRYWEQEFTQLKPMKRRGNRRYYQHHEVLLIRRIRDLLYDQGFTISGARNQLGDLMAGRPAAAMDQADMDGPQDQADQYPRDAGLASDGARPVQADLALDGLVGAASAQPLAAATRAQKVRDDQARWDGLPPSGAVLAPLAPAQLRVELLAIKALLTG